MVTDRVFMATVAYKDATFSSDVAHSSDGSAPIELPVTIYEYTSDTSALSVDRMHVFFDFTNPGTVQVVELYIISNNSNRVVTAQETGQPVLNFNLPVAASNLQFQDSVLGERYVETETGFGDTASILPGAGQHQILFAFDLPYENKASFSLPAPLPVQAVVLMLPDSGVKLKGDGLVDGGARDVQGSQFRLYNASNLEAGSDLEISLSGKPSQDISGAQPENRTNLILGLGVFGLALTISGYYIYRSRNKPNPNAEETIGGEADPEPVPPEDEDTDTLFEAIITLDDQFRAGKLPEAAYRERRAELKARLSEKMKGPDHR
jgi:hypothetical protein